MSARPGCPKSLAQLKGIYNALLHGKRLLILADDARDAAQVRPFSRQLAAPCWSPAATAFDCRGCRCSTWARCRWQRPSSCCSRSAHGSSAQAPELARRCGYLPLALRISATLLANRPSRKVVDYLGQLANERTRLAQLRDPHDPELDLEASIQLSYDALTDTARAAFQQLSVFPASFTLEAASQVLALPDGDAVDLLLEELGLLSLLDYDQELRAL